MFKGLPQDHVSIRYTNRNDIAPHYLQLIEALAAAQAGSLAKQAGGLLQFVELSEQQKNQIVSIPQRTTLSAEQLRQAQLEKYLNLTPMQPSQPQQRDCFRDAICY